MEENKNTIGQLEELTYIPEDSFIMVTRKGIKNYKVKSKVFFEQILKPFEDIVEEINGIDEQDKSLNTLSEIKKFLVGFNDNTTLSGVLYDLKREIINELKEDSV